LVRALWVQARRFVLEEVAEPVDVGGIYAEVIAAGHFGTLLGIGGVFPAAWSGADCVKAEVDQGAWGVAGRCPPLHE
jgi:hypothetical protein